jgi:hypothetical protein
MKKQIGIVHYNTPELTEACILSLRKTGCFWPVTILDNSDRRPFEAKLPGVTVLDNTKGQLINFDAELAKYPDRSFEKTKVSNFGSVKHMLSVQYLWDALADGFILLESDILLRKSIEFLWDERFAAAGKVQYLQKVGRKEKDRLIPMCLYMNVPLLKANGARFFDPQRSWWLQKGENNVGNMYDTGACLLEDIQNTKPQLVARCYPNLYDFYAHYGSGSWRKTDKEDQLRWLAKFAPLWKPNGKYKLGAVGEDTPNAKIYICAHGDFMPQVKHPIYETIDAREFGEDKRGVFLSEIFAYQKIAKKKVLPKIIGFCGYRKYFEFMDDVPTLNEDTKIVSKRTNLGMPMVEQYSRFANPADLQLCTDVIDEKYKDFADAWHKALESQELHPCSMFIMPSKEFRKMMKLVNGILAEWEKRAGNIEERVNANPKAYHVDDVGFKYACRVGGQLGERIISAFMDWQMQDAKEVGIVITQNRC